MQSLKNKFFRQCFVTFAAGGAAIPMVFPSESAPIPQRKEAFANAKAMVIEMTKQEFIDALRTKLSGLPKQDVEERLSFYSEMIDDRMEEGMSEEDAVSQIGSVDEIASQIISEIPLSKIVKEKIKPKKRLTACEIVLLVLGAPLWLPLLLAAISIIFSIYIVIWSVIISLWAVEVSFISGSLGGVISGIIYILLENRSAGIAMIGAGITFAGLSIFLFLGCMGATKGILLLTKKIALGIKNLFIKKENL